MAYLARIESHTAQPVAFLPKVVPAPAPFAPAPEFSALEWSVIRLARVDGLSTLREPGRLGRFLNWLMGRGGSPVLANPRLEAQIMAVRPFNPKSIALLPRKTRPKTKPGSRMALIGVQSGLRLAFAHETLELFAVARFPQAIEVIGEFGLLRFQPLQRVGLVGIKGGIA